MDPALHKQLQADAQREAILVGKAQSRQQLSAADKHDLEQIASRRQAIVDERRKSLEAPFAHLTPLPPPLPRYENTAFGPSEMEFFTWCIGGRQDAVEEYIEAQRTQTSDALLQRALASACEGGKAQVARFLMQKGARVHGVAVEHACQKCDLELFEVLIEHGWHPNQQAPSAQGHFGVALSHCVQNLQVVKLLLTHGADPNLGAFDRRIRGGFGDTPPMNRKSGVALEAAAACGNTDVIDLLLQYGAILEWSTPLHAILNTAGPWERKRPAFVYLLGLGADPNRNITYKYRNQWEGGTPLFWAMRFDNWDAVELLLESGADPEFCNLAAIVKLFGKTKGFMAAVEKVKQKKINAT